MILSDKETELLKLLKNDSRKTVAALARDLGLSRPTVQSMLDKLESVAIKRYTVEFKPEFNDKFIRAFVFMIRDPKHWQRVRESMLKISEVRSIHTVTGQYDAIVELRVDSGNFSRMDQILNEIVMMEGVIRTHTTMVLTSMEM